MYDVYPTSWPALGRPESSQDAINRKVLFEARMATDVRGTEAAVPMAGLVARLRSAFSMQPRRVESCATCPA